MKKLSLCAGLLLLNSLSFGMDSVEEESLVDKEWREAKNSDFVRQLTQLESALDTTEYCKQFRFGDNERLTVLQEFDEDRGVDYFKIIHTRGGQTITDQTIFAKKYTQDGKFDKSQAFPKVEKFTLSVDKKKLLGNLGVRGSFFVVVDLQEQTLTKYSAIYQIDGGLPLWQLPDEFKQCALVAPRSMMENGFVKSLGK